MTSETSRTARNLPVACQLDEAAGGRRVDEWRRLEDEYAIEWNLGDDELTVRYEPHADAVRRLEALVASERLCCAFVDWSIDRSNDVLRLVVRGEHFALASLPLVG